MRGLRKHISALRRTCSRRHLGAIFALVGFASQFPVPAIHVCPVMNPHGFAEMLHGDGEAPDHAHTHHHAHHGHEHDSEPDLRRVVAALPPCHQRLLAATQTAAPPAEPAAEAESTQHGPHGHESCPICQGHAQMLVQLPAPALTALVILHQFEEQFADFVAGMPVAPAYLLPQSRAPPAV